MNYNWWRNIPIEGNMHRQESEFMQARFHVWDEAFEKAELYSGSLGYYIIENPYLSSGQVMIMIKGDRLFVADIYEFCIKTWGITEGTKWAIEVAKFRLNNFINKLCEPYETK